MNNYQSDQTNIDIDIEIWISSHIHSEQRYEWAKETLKSLVNQTYPNFKIYISWSKESFIDTDLDNIVTESNQKQIRLFYQQHRKTQFEHLRFIYENRLTLQSTSTANKTFILFCDDDDLYHPLRVETIIKTINLCTEQSTDIKVLRDYKFDIDGFYKTTDLPSDVEIVDFEDNDESLIMPFSRRKYDFGNYGCDLDLITNFFDKNMDYEFIKSTPAMKGVVDLCFTIYLKEYMAPNSIIKNALYFKRSARSLETLCSCWQLDNNYNLENFIDSYNLKKILCSMSS